MEKELYYANYELFQHENSPLPEKAKGAFVNLYVYEADIDTAKSRFADILNEMGYQKCELLDHRKISEGSEVLKADEIYPEDTEEYKNNGEVFWGPFYCYEQAD